MKPEPKQEGWVSFLRIYCREGYIDRWMGDIAHDPNKTEQSQWCLNAFATYYRLNGEGEWINAHDFKRDFWGVLGNGIEHRTSNDIWEENCISQNQE
jgi:hypothetical protein